MELHSAVSDQLKACDSSTAFQANKIGRVDLRWPASDLTHAIVRRGCRDADVIDLNERLDYVEQTGDGTHEGWY